MVTFDVYVLSRFERLLAAEALRRNEIDTQRALDDLTNPEKNAVVQVFCLTVHSARLFLSGSSICDPDCSYDARSKKICGPHFLWLTLFLLWAPRLIVDTPKFLCNCMTLILCCQFGSFWLNRPKLFGLVFGQATKPSRPIQNSIFWTCLAIWSKWPVFSRKGKICNFFFQFHYQQKGSSFWIMY